MIVLCLIEPTVVPRNPLDVLAQQIVATVAAAAAAGGAADSAPEEGAVNVDELYALVTATYSFSTLSRDGRCQSFD